MDLTRHIDGYCERTDPSFWAEPVNAVTNLAFILVGLYLMGLARTRGRLDGPVLWLTTLIVVIGTGSFLFHTYATVWAAMADTGPIMLFILSYFAIAMRHLVGMSWGKALAATGGYLIAMGLMSWGFRVTLAPLMGTSTSYLPALAGLLAVGAWLKIRGRTGDGQAGAGLLTAAGLFTLSLTLRTIDYPLCEAWPIGTHFLWHILNAAVLGTLVITLIRHGNRRLPDPSPAG